MPAFPHGDGRGGIELPALHPVELLLVEGDHALQKGGTAAKVSDDKEGLFDFLLHVAAVKDIVDQKSEPSVQDDKGKEEKEPYKETQALACYRYMPERGKNIIPEALKIKRHNFMKDRT